jgi:SAM-dependent methyltransferase
MYRILKPGGKAIFIEPIAYNPVINVYRKMAMDVRTDDEHPLKIRDLRIIEKYFGTAKHREFWFFSLFIFIYFYLIEKVHPKSERYWKKVIYDAPKYEKMFKKLKKIDDTVLSLMPFLGLFCWNTVIEVQKMNKHASKK